MEDMDFSHLYVEFFMEAVENKKRSDQEGRPIFDDIEKIRIRMAGDRGTELVAPANSPSAFRDPHTNRRLTYAEVHEGPYKAFKSGIEYTGEGTPISELPFITNARAKEFQALNIKTAEALAGLDGEALKRAGMGARELKNKAQAYIDNASGVAQVTEISQENAALREQMAQLQEQMAQLVNGAPQSGTLIETPVDPVTTAAASPFKDWADADIVNWITDNGGEKPSHLCKHGTLVAKADAWNEKIRREQEAA
ncbi:MAG: hypothetical protein GY952_11660 [Rhodobacteraceae bacterium]|nr:hypothetical protein [Paracoccaceae bacterium]